ncbi:hypothetical protein C8F04DRAFT_1261353 [Mycena alexandri]|uniref:Uncharacterized protein n=1 Tax=Mycena alexandri TaxID=1745969 RepID=A0AAD6SWE5_9AGAR|nr:hypothetical protein C8F04DRAFT_1278754 [Mycena alexandri]KAJ7033012.1 hypothetical protein C8F04DRAFT_1261353 [Mycena alexandri]
MLKKSRKSRPKDSDTYRPGLSKEEKARNHRKAQKSYIERNPLAREAHRARMAASREAKKARKRRWDEPRVQTRLATPSWADLELPARSEMRTAPVADRHTVYSARSREGIAIEERIAVDALVTLSQPQHIAEEWARPPSDSILERAMGLTSSSASSPPASLRPAARNAANAGAADAGATVRDALDAVARVNEDHPLPRQPWPNAACREYYRAFWIRDDHRRFLGEFLSLDTYVAVRRWRLHTYNSITYDEFAEPLESHSAFHSRWPVGIS